MEALVVVGVFVLLGVLLGRALRAGDDAEGLLRLALAIAGLAVVKLFLFDLGRLDAIARVAAFLAVGLLLLFIGTQYAKAWERARREADQPDAVPADAPVAAAVDGRVDGAKG